MTRHLFFRGRSGLAAILDALRLQDGDEVITQAFTCVAVPEGILAAGGTPVFADVRSGSVNVDPSDVAAKLTPRTRAIVVQHTFGVAAPLEELQQVLRDTEVAIIEDCCHTFATRIGGRTAGTIGAAAFYSFEWGKPLPCGVGGAVVTNNRVIEEALCERGKRLRPVSVARRIRLELQYQGFRFCYRPKSYWTVKSLFNSLSRAGAAEGNFGDFDFGKPSADFELAISPSVERRIRRRTAEIPAISEHAQTVTAQYQSMELGGGVERVTDALSGAVLARYPLWARDREKLLARAKQRKIEVADWYKTVVHPLTDTGLRAVNYSPGSCPEAEVACKRIISLPTNRFVDRRFLDETRSLLSA